MERNIFSVTVNPSDRSDCCWKEKGILRNEASEKSSRNTDQKKMAVSLSIFFKTIIMVPRNRTKSKYRKLQQSKIS